LSAWAQISKDPWILDLIQYGFKLEFLETPIGCDSIANTFLNAEQTKICDEEIKSLLGKGAISPSKGTGFFSSIFVIPKKSGGFRPIINFKKLNKYVLYRHFKMEGLNTVNHTVRAGDWFVKLDLQDAYLTVPIFKEHQQYLHFSWKMINYHFTCLPFGLSSAPWAFTKLMRPIVAYLRKAGIRLVIYLDDILIMAQSKLEAISAVETVRFTLESLGFIINESKSICDPTQTIEFLGIMINSLTLAFSLPIRKVESLINSCKKVLNSKTILLRDLATILGNLNWTAIAVPYARSHYRECQRFYIEKLRELSNNLNSCVTLPSIAKKELSWWIENVNPSTHKFIYTSDPSLEIFSDASLSGWGAVCNGIKTNGPWSDSESKRHINELELIAALNSLMCFTSESINCAVSLRIDNTTAVTYINKLGGTKSKRLCNIALKIAHWCETRNIEIQAFYLPGYLNVLADRESRRCQNAGDWKLTTEAFNLISREWDPKVDLFASAWNAQLPLFVSWLPQPGSWRTNAFSLDWKNLQGYAFPPMNLIQNCLSKIIRDQASLILICPYWPSQSWFPILLELAVDIPRIFSFQSNLLSSAQKENHPQILDGSLRLVAWKLSGVTSASKAFRTKLQTFYWRDQDPQQSLHTSLPGSHGEIGAYKGITIPCLVV